MQKKLWTQFRWPYLAVSLAVGCAFALTALRPTHASTPPASLFGDDYYCPASQHSCNFTGRTEPYFAPDPFDVGAGCDNTFLNWDPNTQAPDPSSCYGNCDANDPTTPCYTTCQDNYSSCLRGAFGLGARPQPIGGSTTPNPRRTGLVAGNIFRSCLAGTVPTLYQDEYNSCIASGGSTQDCCSLVSSHYP